ncbi:ATPase [Fischerella thermalis WC442]|uniref:cation-translocating P-type ATPase n=2 Tax=Fischerella thermalis TaxID=372787 RepID=UPI000C809E84|nr:HAD-IC family P-type ATPase [Fischerella thermalis]PLZ29453.1 ATPase [Fischerella thermalis WC558]PLZ48448.1 ATPase [Fischerella thermalis WC442]PLZ53509.1 ATPase [Fischerella thermalis WC439]
MVKIIHNQVKGRARYKVKELYRSESLKKYLERSLSETSGINYVSANPSTSNILVIFEKEYSADKVALLIEQNISQYQKLANKSLEKYSSKTKKELTKATQKPIVNAQAQRIKNWHLMETDAVLTAFNTSKQSGLSSKSAAENLNKYGPNFLATAKTRSDLSILIDQFKSLPVALLGVAAGVSVFTRGLIDALVILGVVGLNAAIGYRTESQSERIIHSLGSHQETSTWVIRNGKQIEIPIEDVVIGDILVLKTGGYIAADARLLEAENLSVDESALTGESIPVTKSTSSLTGEDIPLADRTNMVYKGTLVTGGQGLAVVVATAKFTEMGKIQQLVGEATTTETPLTRQLNQVGSQLVAIGMGICGLVFGIGVLRGYGLLQMLQSSISLAVAAVPEGLPTIATTTLALGIQDMRQRNVLVRSLSAVEALGSVQTICLDKTGTITENRMSVVEVHTDSQQINVSEGEFIANGENINPYACDQLLKLIHVSVLCNESEVNQDQDGEYSIKGSATENALIHMAIAAGVNVTQLRQKYKLLHTNLRSENRNIMSTVHTTENHHNLVAVKGSPGEVAQICKFWFKDGEITTLTEQDRRAIEIENDRMAGKALRVLGIAYTILDENNNRQNPEQDLTWLGLVGMADPVRKGVKELIAQFHEAGIDTVMITGDQSPTAYAIAKELELSRESQLEILDSTDLNNLTPEALTALADKVDVFARISPSNKLQIVQALQSAGQVVAMTGDGINDAPALKAAQVGVAMGKGGTDVAREVADIVLEDDRLETMIVAVSQGRTIYNNIRKSVHFLLATNISEIIVMTTATAVGIGEPLNAIQLLWLNLVTDIFPGLSLALEAPEPDVLSQPPRNPEEPILKRSDFGRIAFEAGSISLSTLAAYGYSIRKYGISPQASTIAFMSLTSAQLLHTISCRSEKHSIFNSEKIPNNPYLNAAIVGSFAIQLLAIALPPLRSLLKLTPINIVDGLVIGASALLPLLVNESTKNMSLGENHNTLPYLHKHSLPK